MAARSGIGAAPVARLRAAGARVAVLDLCTTAPDADLSLPCDSGDEQQVVSSGGPLSNTWRVESDRHAAGRSAGWALLDLSTDRVGFA